MMFELMSPGGCACRKNDLRMFLDAAGTPQLTRTFEDVTRQRTAEHFRK